MRTQKEILEKISKLRDDMFGDRHLALLSCLTFNNAKRFLKDDVASDDWEGSNKREVVLENMEDYMSFALGETRCGKGMFPYQALCHYETWIWVLEDEKHLKKKKKGLSGYGKDELIAICNHYGWNVTN